MECRYCGYEPAASPCPLCAENGADPELFARPRPTEYRLTLVAPPGVELPEELEARLRTSAHKALPRPTGDSTRPSYYLYTLEELAPFLELMREIGGEPKLELRFNGKPYPYTHELWLPLLRFLLTE
jgi:hypothetical protein